MDAWRRDGTTTARSELATAVRWTLATLAGQVPGRTVEVRVPPYGAVQCIDGPVHTRGTPPNVVETDPQSWLSLATGAEAFADAKARGAIRASGTRADLTAYLPVVDGPVGHKEGDTGEGPDH